ncbi:MAG: Trm112 family protein [Rhodobacteraceae bacterium]|nr:Trm112 family protein [Paracoccaceae bacterium]
MSGTADSDPKMIESLVCPVSHRPLSFDADRQELVSKSAKLAFPIRNGIPILLIDEARPLEDRRA